MVPHMQTSSNFKELLKILMGKAIKIKKQNANLDSEYLLYTYLIITPGLTVATTNIAIHIASITVATPAALILW